MEKQTIDLKVNHSLEWYDDIIEIAKMQKDLDDAKRLGATHIRITTEDSWGYPVLTIYAIMRRVETDDEYKERVLAEKAQQEAVKNRELAELKRLKQKYE